MADVTFRRGVEANLPTSGMATEGCVYQSTDTGNMYVGSSQGTLIPVNRSPYYGTCVTEAGANAKVVTLDVDNDNFTMKAGVMISVLFSNANTAASPTLNVNGKGAVSVKVYGITNVSASPRAWEAGEVVTFVHNGTHWVMVGRKTQSDWNQTDTAALDFIKNKPTNVSDFLNDVGYITTEDLPSPYSLPIASSSTLGGVKVGSGLAISSGGVLSATGGGIADSVAWGNITGTLEDQSDLDTALGQKANTEDLASVAFSGSYNELSDKPTIPTVNNATLTINQGGVLKGTFTANASQDVTINLGEGLSSVDWDDVTNKPDFATVATSGSYEDLEDKPTIPSAQIQSDWSQTNASSLDFIKNKPTIPTVGTLNTDNETAQTVNSSESLGGSINLHKVSKTGSYNDLIGKPAIPDSTSDLTNDSGFITSADIPSPADASPLMDGTASVGSSVDYAREDHVHPTDTSRAPLASPSFTGTPTAPTAATGTNTTQIATTAFVQNATSGLAVDANVVHKTGNENVSGTKTFNNNVVLGTNANLVLSSAQDEGVYIEANSSSGGQQALTFSSLDDDSAVKLENVALPTANSDAANKQYVDDAIGNTYVSLKGTTNASAQETYSVYPYSLCAFSTCVYPQTYMIMTSLALSGGLSNKTPYTAHWFPIGCKIYYYNEGTALSGAFSSQRFYTTHNGVDARYSAITGDNIDLFSDISGGAVYLRVEIRENNVEWRPYYKQGETNEIIVSGTQLEVGGFYIYLGRSVVSSDYMFQLEDNNPLYACVMDGFGTHLVDWATYNSSRTPYLVKNIQLFPSSVFPIGNNPIIGNTGIYSRKSYLDGSYLEGVYKVSLQLHAWWDSAAGALDTPQPLSVIVKHNTNDKITGGTFVIPVIESPNDSNYKMGTLVVNLVGFVTFTSAQTINDYIEVKVQGAKGINLGGEHPLWGENEGDVEYNDGLILERIDWYNPT